MYKVSTEKALSNELASVRMEGFNFSDSEINNVRKCLSGEMTFKQFTEMIVSDVKSK